MVYIAFPVYWLYNKINTVRVLTCIYYDWLSPSLLKFVIVVRMEIFVWWMGLTTAVVEWSSVMKESGGQCVMMVGMRRMLVLCADN